MVQIVTRSALWDGMMVGVRNLVSELGVRLRQMTSDACDLQAIRRRLEMK
jgi:hypothetical protein